MERHFVLRGILKLWVGFRKVGVYQASLCPSYCVTLRRMSYRRPLINSTFSFFIGGWPLCNQCSLFWWYWSNEFLSSVYEWKRQQQSMEWEMRYVRAKSSLPQVIGSEPWIRYKYLLDSLEPNTSTSENTGKFSYAQPGHAVGKQEYHIPAQVTGLACQYFYIGWE